MNYSVLCKGSRTLGLVFFLLIFSSLLFGQGFQLILDPINPFQKGSLFNLSVLNNSNYSGQLILKASLKSRRGKVLMVQESRQEVNSSISKSIRGEGIRYQTNYTDAEFARLYQQSNQLPPMNYVLCVEAFAVGDQALRSEECIEYEAADFINITGVYPPEEGEIGEQRPLFVWLNPDQQSPYSYDFRLVALQEGQRPNTAMRRNNPLVAIDGWTSNLLPYPSDALPLENGIQYVWQLGINYNGERVSQTDANTFTYKENMEYINFPKKLPYVDITEIKNGTKLYAIGAFKFKYPSISEGQFEVSLFELKEESKKQLDLPDHLLEVDAGLNKFELDLREQVYLKHQKDYLVLLKNKSTGETYQYQITYINPDYIK